ncbi:sensor histidine kinase [Actinomadura montaniterrae]|uniref:histidine kinase n=1 Tax=Actinomadura montaniterrae TaxID=1803903 RepID=A0A6L3W2V0_9ACTN|nr:sensor histidine kinase [Actinomadura montaniterrae]KAB2385913.1 sensor histidine kinase [Actinomadura montaniterrae]
MNRPRRRRSIRSSLYGLLVIPMISLVALWLFAAQSTAAEAIDQRNIDTANKIYGNAVQPMLLTLAQERQETVVWLSGGLPRGPLDAVRKRMDSTIVRMNGAAHSGTFQETLTGPMKSRLSVLMDKLNRIDAIRKQVDSGAMTKLSAFEAYNDVLDTHFKFVYLLVAGNGYQQAYHLTGMSRAMELLGREAALVGGLLADGGRMTAAERTAISQLAFERRYLENSSLSEFTPANGAPFRRALASDEAKRFVDVENRILAAGPGTRLRLPSSGWQNVAGAFLQQMDVALREARVVLAGDAKRSSDRTLLRLAGVGGAGLVAVLLTAVLMLRFGRRIGRDLLGLQSAARELADDRLPGVVARLSRGDEVDVAAEAPPLVVGRTVEVANVAAAFSTVQHTAIDAAVGQADLRRAVNAVFQNLARRNQSLLHRQLSMLDTLERKASAPDALADLFAIDHLITRMRRHAEGLIILSGASPGRGWRHPVGLLDVLRGAIGEIEDYARVEVASTAEEGIVGSAVAGVIRLLAELIENAVSFSPPNTPVEIDAGRVGQGVVVEIQDRGLGMSEDELAAANVRLGQEPEFDLSQGEQLGLFVVGKLAHRHGIRVVLEPNAYGGVKTIVLLPHSIVVSPDRIGRADADRTVDAENVPHFGRRRPEEQRPGVSAAAFSPAETPRQAAAAAAAGTHAGMPRRVRRASLAPQLKESGSPAPDAPRPARHRTRSPEQAKSVMEAMQRGWERGRSEPGPAAEPDDDTGER